MNLDIYFFIDLNLKLIIFNIDDIISYGVDVFLNILEFLVNKDLVFKKLF